MCLKGLCVCATGYGGGSCEREAVCHYWDRSRAAWSSEGLTTLHPRAEAGTSAVVRCVLHGLPLQTTEYAALWTLVPPAPQYNISDSSLALSALPIQSNPVAITVIMMVLLNLLTLLVSWKYRHVSQRGMLGEWKSRPKEQFPDSMKPAAFFTKYVKPLLAKLFPKKEALDSSHAVVPRAGTPSSPARLALKGPEVRPSTPVAAKLPTLLASFIVEGIVTTFDDATLLRRLATLLGVPDSNVGATLSAGKLAGQLVVDVEIGCFDARSLVMAAKALRTSIGPLGVALGIKLVDKPRLEVMALPDEPSSEAGSSPSRRPVERAADVVVPTIQERIPTLALRSGARKARDALATREQGSPTIWEPPSPLNDPGIQERIPLPGFGAARRSSVNASAMRLRTASGVLSSLGLDTGDLYGAGAIAGAGESSHSSTRDRTSAPSLSDGIQERLPVRQSMRRRKTGELPPASRLGLATELIGSPQASEEGSSMAAQAQAAAMTALAAATMQERIPRLGPRAPPQPVWLPPPASPPPSPPQVIPYSPARKGGPPAPLVPRTATATTTSTALVVVGGGGGGGGADAVWLPQMQMRITKFTPKLGLASPTPPKVLPPWSKPTTLEETWDDRSPSEIAWGAAREHTLFGLIAALLWGYGPKLATVAQAAQLVWGSLFGLLYLCCAQLRYGWMGGAWASTDEGASLLNRISSISSVALAASLICWPCVLLARWLFLAANRTRRLAGLDSPTSTIVQAGVWSAVLGCVLALAIGTISVSAYMPGEKVREDAMLGLMT